VHNTCLHTHEYSRCKKYMQLVICVDNDNWLDKKLNTIQISTGTL